MIRFFSFFILRFLYRGMINLFEFPKVCRLYLGGILLFNFYIIVSYGMIGFISSIFITILFSIPFITVIRIVYLISTHKLRKQQQYFKKLFTDMKLLSTNGEPPLFFHEEQVSEYVTILFFKSLIPVDIWNNKKSLLETFLNAKITRIINEQNNKNIILLYVTLKDLPELIEWNDEYIMADNNVLSMGFNETDCIVMDLNRNPHTFIAGETGSGKTNLLKCLIYQCLIKKHEVKLIDFKRGVSFSVFRDFVKVYSDYEKIKIVLQDLVQETNKRLDLFFHYGVEDINEYNQLSMPPMQRIIVFIDELAELMRTSDKEAQKVIINALETLTRLSRAVGINLIMGLQRPDSTIINGQIKNNVSLRICGRFIDPEPSRIMLNSDIATSIPNIKGRFLIKDTETTEFQAFRVTNDNMKYLEYYRIHKSIENKESADTIKNESVEKIIEDDKNQNVLDFNFDDII